MNAPPANTTVHQMMRCIGSTTMLLDPHGHPVSRLLIARCLHENNSELARLCSDNLGLQELWSRSVCLLAAVPTPASVAPRQIPCARASQGTRSWQRVAEARAAYAWRCADRGVSYRCAALRGRSGAPGCGGTDFAAHCRPQRLGAPARTHSSACEPTPRMHLAHEADHTAVADSRDRRQRPTASASGTMQGEWQR